MRKEVIALGEQMQVLEDARRAGVTFAGKLRSEPKHIPEEEISKKVLKEFEGFKKNIKKGAIEIPEKMIAKQFLLGFQESYFDD